MEIVGVIDVDKVQGDFLTTLRQRDKISVDVNVQEELRQHVGSDLLTLYVPEAHRSEKPVFLSRDIRRAFVRRGGRSLGVSNRKYLKEHHLDPLIQFGIVTMTNPEKPGASNQNYVITDAGAKLKARRVLRNNYRDEEEND